MMKHLFIFTFLLLSLSDISNASEITINALNKTGGRTADYIRVERCSNGTIAVGNDFNELTRQGVSNPCAANPAVSSGYVKNIGTQLGIYFGFDNKSVSVGLNGIGSGFQIMYTGTQVGAGVFNNLPSQAEKDFLSSVHKCLLLIKSNLANEIVIQASSQNATCNSY